MFIRNYIQFRVSNEFIWNWNLTEVVVWCFNTFFKNTNKKKKNLKLISAWIFCSPNYKSDGSTSRAFFVAVKTGKKWENFTQKHGVLMIWFSLWTLWNWSGYNCESHLNARLLNQVRIASILIWKKRVHMRVWFRIFEAPSLLNFFLCSEFSIYWIIYIHSYRKCTSGSEVFD